MVERVVPTVRYVSVEGPVTRVIPGTDELLLEITERWLTADLREATLAAFARLAAPGETWAAGGLLRRCA